MGRKKVNKRGNNEGSIRLRKDGRYEARVTLGVDASGKQIQKSIYGKERADVVYKMTDTMMNLYNGTYIEETDIMLGTWVIKWLDEYAKYKVKETTLEVYDIYTKKHIIPQMGKIKLSQLKTSYIQSFINQLADKGLSAGTIIFIMRIIKGALNQAVIEKMIKENVANNCAMPKDLQKEMKTLSPKDTNAFLEETKKDRFYCLFLLEISSGVRRGEILGLRWKDINFDEGYIDVKQQVVLLKNKPCIQSLKTKHSTRRVYIPQNVVLELEKYNKLQKIQKIKNKKTWNTEDLVFTNQLGGIMSPRNLLRTFKTILRKAKLPLDVRFHDLRHTYALNCLNNGVDIRTLQEQLGHHNASFTIQRYGHSSPEMKKNAATKMGDFLNHYIK